VQCTRTYRCGGGGGRRTQCGEVGEELLEFSHTVDGTVEVAQPVGNIVQQRQSAAVGQRAEADDERQNVPRRPAQNERSQDDGDGAQSLPGAVLAFASGRR